MLSGFTPDCHKPGDRVKKASRLYGLFEKLDPLLCFIGCNDTALLRGTHTFNETRNRAYRLVVGRNMDEKAGGKAPAFSSTFCKSALSTVIKRAAFTRTWYVQIGQIAQRSRRLAGAEPPRSA